jgi:hypothetical protein
MTDLTTTTVRTQAVPLQSTENEVEAARTAYLKSYDAWAEMPTIINKQARDKAYDYLQHVKSLYSAARAALIQKRVIDRQ